jgi:antitoxin (DNA-binding transcriptional repressor) of toxin-antitoxin stability system
MKFISVRDLRTSPAKIWKELPEEQEMVITNNGKPFALLTPLSENNLEETLATIRQARAQKAVQMMQIHSVNSKNSGLSDEEIENEIQAYRKEK